MEPDVMVVHPSQPSLDAHDDSRSEEDFGDFGVFTEGISLESSSSSLVQHSSTEASHQPNCSSHLFQQSRLTSSMSSFSEEQQSDTEPSTVLSNRFSCTASLEETGFADFTVLTEEASHSWCCGFSPVAEQWSNEIRKAHNLNEPQQEVVIEPKSSFVFVKNSEVKHCVQTEAQLSQNQSQADVANLSCVWAIREGSLQLSERGFTDEGQESPADSSFCDDISFEGHSEDLEHNVSSLACTSQEDQTDEEERSISSLDGVMDFCHSNNHAAQETSATSSEERPAASNGQVPAVEVHCLSSLPASDSFADFCSAPIHDDEDEHWEFEEHKTGKENGHFVHPKEEEEESEKRICQATVSDRVQNLVHNSFPEEEVKEDGEQEVPSLGVLLHLYDFEAEKEEMPAVRPTRMQGGCWWPLQDIHTALGLQFQWAGSHTNRSLLRCLGVDTKNIVFIGVRKQPVCVPAFASNLGMLEPTKDSVAEYCSSGSTVASESRNSSTNSKQDPLSASQLVCSSRGLSSSQDGCSSFNLDYFGALESSSSSGSNTPPPGVDPELYKLTFCEPETSIVIKHLENTLNDLMATLENTSIRQLDQEEELSPEASRMISGLPSLSFMKARFLMFPCSLAQKTV